MSRQNILVVDDEREITDAIDIYLTNEGYMVYKAYDGVEALNILENRSIDLVLLDVMMPRLDGIRTTVQIRKNKNIPIIMLSAKSEDTDKILGLNIGADDYITKPFNPLELIARVKSQLRRANSYSNQGTNNILVTGGLELNTETKEVSVDGKAIKVTPLEFKILHLLMSNMGRVFSIEEIYERVWNEPAYNADTVTVHIRRIREKIEINTKEPKYLKVVWGVGYKMDKQ
ncbi:MAG: response regulator transcription factor [Sarcina sp.]